MKRIEFEQSLASIFQECLAISKAKNADYADDSDPFKNFQTATLANITVAQGIFVRLLDKVTRTGNLLTRDAVVKDEKIEDTLKDLINYGAILLTHLRDKK